jgi:hypothetical protein
LRRRCVIVPNTNPVEGVAAETQQIAPAAGALSIERIVASKEIGSLKSTVSQCGLEDVLPCTCRISREQLKKASLACPESVGSHHFFTHGRKILTAESCSPLGSGCEGECHRCETKITAICRSLASKNIRSCAAERSSCRGNADSSLTKAQRDQKDPAWRLPYAPLKFSLSISSVRNLLTLYL